MITLPLGITQQAAGGSSPAYDPGMMTFDGSTGYYFNSNIVTSGNKVTGVARFNRASFTGGGFEAIFRFDGPNSKQRLSAYVHSSDYATAGRQSRVLMICQDSAGTNVCRLFSTDVACDGTDKLLFCSFDGDTGSATFYIDNVDADDTGNVERVAPTTGTLDSGSGSDCSVAGGNGTLLLGGKVGYCGHSESYLTNPEDFGTGASPLELDEVTWTEWGAQPLFWNEFGTMSDNKGSAANLGANGTITGPA